MSYAIQIGTTAAIWIDQAATPAGSVRWEGNLPVNPVWDAKINNIRESTPQEIGNAQLRATDAKGVTARQLKLALDAMDQLAAADSLLSESKTWTYKANFTITDQDIKFLRKNLGKPYSFMDQVFRLARTF